MSLHTYQLTWYYALLALTALSVVVMVVIIRTVARRRRALWQLVAAGEIDPQAVIVAQSRWVQEWCRLIQHAALFLIFILALPIGPLQRLTRQHPWVVLTVDCCALALLPGLLLLSSWIQARLDNHFGGTA